MDFPLFLAMTAAEFASCRALPPKIAYMACHFSPSGTGLSGLPKWLPPNSVLMLTDELPPNGHDPRKIALELKASVERLNCSAVLLDLQRPVLPEVKAVVAAAAALPCPVAVSAAYAEDHDCGVLLPPPPLWTTLSDHLKPWKGRTIWLEAAIEGAEVTVTENGSIYTSCSCTPLDSSFSSETLHVDYRTEVKKDRAIFHIRRGRAHMAEFLQEAKGLGVESALGLYQQFRQENAPL